jgi:predicted negative regulator of RcsB-dependent stress response
VYAWCVWQAVTDFLLKAHAVGFSHEAVIAILGAMSILAVLVSFVFAALGFFGYKTIEERSVSAASEKAAQIAAAKTDEEIERFRENAQALALSVSQPPAEKKKRSGTGKSVKKTTDSALRSPRD